MPRCVVHNPFYDWTGDNKIQRPIHHTIIYEVHVKRFFHQKPKDIFNRLLERVSWPVRPRNRRCKIEVKTCSAASALTSLELVA